MKKWWKTLGLFMLVGILLVGCSSKETGSGSDDDKGKVKVLKLGHVWPSDDIHAQAVQKFAAQVNKLSKGKLKIEVYENGTLGTDKDLLEGLKVGTADIWVGGAGTLSSASKTANIFTVPFMFENQDHFNKVYNGDVGQEISDKIEKESGYKILSYWDRGARWLTTNKKVVTPDDLKGLKIRVPDSPVFVKAFKQLGASPTPMDFGEVFTSLQQGVIDGQENPLSLIYTSKFNEVVKYLVKTEHVREPISLVISDNAFNSLDKDLQDVLIKAANGEAKQFAADQVEKGDSDFVKKLQDGGMTLVEPDIAAFQSKLNGFVDKNFPDLKDIYQKIQDAK